MALTHMLSLGQPYDVQTQPVPLGYNKYVITLTLTPHVNMTFTYEIKWKLILIRYAIVKAIIIITTTIIIYY